jgi:hypothetical protein
MTNWNDFNDAQPQAGFDLLPRGTLVLVRMSIKPGGFDDAEQGWTGGWATASHETGSVYLSAEFVVLDGPHAKRKLWSNIGLHSPKGDEWANMGRAFIRAALNSARGVSAKDTSEAAQAARHITHFGELDGLVFVGRIDVEKDPRGDDKNLIKQAIEPDHKEYARLMAGAAGMAASAPTVHAPQVNNLARPVPNGVPAAAFTKKPTWAE